MKTVSLYIKNIGLIVEETIPLDKPLILFFGEIRQGKTTILNAVRYVFGGTFPTDLLRHGEAEGEICLTFDDRYIRRTFYRGDDGTVKGRPIEYVINDIRQPKPVEALKQLINPFLLDQDHLIRMTELERKKYFVTLFNADTSEIDNKLKGDEAKASLIRAELKGFGNIDLTEHVKPNVEDIQKRLAEVKRINAADLNTYNEMCKDVQAFNRDVTENEGVAQSWLTNIAELEARLVEARKSHKAVADWLAVNPKRYEPAPPLPTSTAELDAELSDAKAQQVRHEGYLANLARSNRKDVLETELAVLESEIRETRRLKVEALKRINEENGIPGLVFGDGGTFTFEDTQAGMLSTSQMMKLSTQLSALYPEGLGIDLIDRAESLGKSIFAYVDRAKTEQKTILATIVGERPAVVPENIGVFVVEDGKLK